MATCDLCASSTTAGHRIAAGDFCLAVDGGLQPPERELTIARGLGVAPDEFLTQWRTKARTDASDWLLCEECHNRYQLASHEGKKKADGEALVQYTMKKLSSHAHAVEHWLAILQDKIPRWQHLSPTDRAECQQGLKWLSNSSVFAACGKKGDDFKRAYEAIESEYRDQRETEKEARRRTRKWWQFWIP
jgi:hypothetical protein